MIKKKRRKKKFRNETVSNSRIFRERCSGHDHNSEASFINSHLDITNVVEVNFDKAVLMMTTN